MSFEVLHRFGKLLPTMASGSKSRPVLAISTSSAENGTDFWPIFFSNESVQLYRRLAANYPELEQQRRALYSMDELADKQPAYFHVPKFLQAVLTLIVCTILMSTTLCLIIRVKLWCRSRFGRQKRGCNSPVGLEGVRVHIHPNHNMNGVTNINNSGPSSLTSSDGVSNKCSPNSTTPQQPSPGKAFAFHPRMGRRTSGPFGEEALEFAHQSYYKKKPTKSTLQNGNPITKLITPNKAAQTNDDVQDENYRTKL